MHMLACQDWAQSLILRWDRRVHSWRSAVSTVCICSGWPVALLLNDVTWGRHCPIACRLNLLPHQSRIKISSIVPAGLLFHVSKREVISTLLSIPHCPLTFAIGLPSEGSSFWGLLLSSSVGSFLLFN